MAALTGVVRVGNKRPVGDRFEVTVRATPGIGSATEWVAKADLGLMTITAVVGAVAIGATALNPVNFTRNAQGTGGTEGTFHGDLGVEQATAGQLLEITVQGY